MKHHKETLEGESKLDLILDFASLVVVATECNLPLEKEKETRFLDL